MFNAAQHVLLALGADPYMLMFGGWKRPASAHHTKRGPGRRHGGKAGSSRLQKPYGYETYAASDRATTIRMNTLHGSNA